ncbi:hypothetical protein HYW76_04835 [Candidatus Pacearchaeota archaeon]|nr:hypothetical protein [Candidatus Pacearchaeota archaeon]
MEEGDNVLCVVESVQGTTVFVRIESGGSGTIVVSEIAPGRIRNLRDYVVPGKKIVCKVLRINENNVHLSLRRVSNKEKQEVLEKYEREKSSINILKSLVKENADSVINEIKKESSSIYEFLVKAKDNIKLLEKYVGKDAEKIVKILKDKKEKEVEIKKEFLLSSDLPNGMTLIRNIVYPHRENIIYLAAGRFVIKIKSGDYKTANQEMSKILQNIEAKSKEAKLKFEIKEK